MKLVSVADSICFLVLLDNLFNLPFFLSLMMTSYSRNGPLFGLDTLILAPCHSDTDRLPTTKYTVILAPRHGDTDRLPTTDAPHQGDTDRLPTTDDPCLMSKEMRWTVSPCSWKNGS